MRHLKLYFLFVLVGTFLHGLNPITSQAADTGWLNPSVNQAYSNGGFETNPAGAYASGGVVAQDARSGGQGNRGDEHVYSGFDLSALPGSATITGVEVKLTARMTATVPDAQMIAMVSKSGLSTWTGTTQTTGTLTATLTDYVRGSVTELWGLGVTRGADLKTTATTFAIKIQDYSGNNSAKIWQLDWLQVRVYYDFVADLTIAKTHPGYPTGFTQGQPGAYSILVGNTGSGATLGTVTVTDTLPVEVIATAISGSGWTCDLPTLTCTRSDALAVGASYPAITLSVNVTTEAAPIVTNTAIVSGGGEINEANNTSTDPVTVTQLVPILNVTKSATDENGGNLEVLETLLYTVVIQNPTGGYLTGGEFTDTIPANTNFIGGSTVAPAGSTVVTESPTLYITGINIPAHSQQTITYRVTVIGGTEVTNQGTVNFDTDGNGSNDGSQLTDGDTTQAGDQQTIIPISAAPEPNFSETTKGVTLIEVAPITGDVSPGDTLRYTITIPNTGDADASGVTFTDAIPANTTYSGVASASSPTLDDHGGAGPIDWSGDIIAGDSVTITFDVEINPGVTVGTVISNQGTVTYNSFDTKTDGDPSPSNPGKQTTDITVGGVPRGDAIKSVTDENGGNLLPGDTLLYTIILDNLTAYSVNGIRFTDAIPSNTTYIAGSATAPAGSTIVTTAPTLEITGINVPANDPGDPTADQQIITFRVQVDNPLTPGVTQISNQGTVYYDIDGDGTNDSTQLTDGDATELGNQFTVIPLGTGPNFDQTTKSAALVADPDANQAITPGDTMRYNVKIRNTGSSDANGVEFTDPLPADLTFLAIVSGGATYNSAPNRIEWTGDVAQGAMHILEFDVTINNDDPDPPPSIGTVISNQGTVFYDSNGDATNDTTVLTDGDYTTLVKETTNFTVGGYPHGYGTKIATDVNGGNLEPGETVLYTIEIHNESGFFGSGLELTDDIPANTTYNAGSAIKPPGSRIVTTTPTLYIDGISVPPHSVVTITFSVTVDNPMPVGVTQISNQADVFYDTNTDGINDFHQLTDGDLTEPGNQPTVSGISGGIISGTVFDDNGSGGGGAGNGAQEIGEPGLSGVTVELLDEFFVLLYGTTTNIDGYYIFTALPSGNYVVRETNPINYISTSPDTVTITALTTSDNAHFGDQFFVGSGADLQISKSCSTLYLDGLPQQLICRIIIKNNGPLDALNVVLTDDFTALIAAGLSNINYTEDGVEPAVAWIGSLSLGDMASGSSHTIRIYADAADTFTPVDNEAAVASSNDPVSGNNSNSCSNLIAMEGRYALDVKSGANAYMSAPGEPSVDVSTTGTIEAWIYPTEFTEDAGIIMKGNTVAGASYGFGLGGGTGGVFTDGTMQNIGFVLYDTSGDFDDKHLLTSTTTLVANKWYHIACVWDFAASPKMAIYINGIQDPAPSPSITDGRFVRVTSETVFVGIQAVTPAGFSGIIDEARIWSSARTPEQIQTTMCRKVYSVDGGYGNLEGYWRFDEDNGDVCIDSSKNGRIGIITNAERICSSAPVGDDSLPDYDEFDGFSVVFNNPAQDERLTVSAETALNWSAALKSGLQVYQVNTNPDYQTGPVGLRLLYDKGFWGVFVTGGNSPTYTIEYNYDITDDGIPGIGSENNLKLAWRHGNCENWKNLEATPGTNTLTQSGLAGTEFILGASIDPRNTINFINVNSNYVAVTDGVAAGDLDPTTYGAIEAWINIASYQDNAGIIHKGNGTNDSYSLYMGTDSGANENQNVYFTIDDGGATPATINSATILNLGTWYHIAGTWDDTANTMTLYINGVQETAGPTITAQDTSGDLYMGVRPTGSPGYFDGYIDEVRVWNITAAANMRTQVLIRDTMCQKLSGSETDLGAYWRFDEETNSVTCPDYSGHGHAGTMTNFGADLTDLIRDARVCSSAPIGDDSAYAYHDPLSATPLTPVTVQLAHTDGDYMVATENGGTWTGMFSGIQLYRVDGAPVYPPDLWTTSPYTYTTPNGLTPPAGWSSVDYYRYWGLFVTDWDDVANQPVYDVVYHYAGNPSVPVDDSVVALARRPEYCFGTWTDSGYVLDSLINDTLTVTGDSQYGPPATNPEYVLGGKDAPLAITLASFSATVADRCVDVIWETATEINTAGFHVWRSDNPLVGFVRITDDLITSKSKMETIGAQYAFTDCDVDFSNGEKYYYMLEEIEIDGPVSGNMHGPIGPVSENVTAAQTSDGGNDKNCFIDSVSCW